MGGGQEHEQRQQRVREVAELTPRGADAELLRGALTEALRMLDLMGEQQQAQQQHAERLERSLAQGRRPRRPSPS